MKKPTKQEIMSRILVCSSVLVLTSPMIAQAASIPASAETISSSATEESPPNSVDTLTEKQEVIEEEQGVTEETTTSEIEESESTENTEASAATEETETAESEAVKETEGTEASTEETTESTTDSSDEKETKTAQAAQATTYNFTDLVDQGVISDVKITWSMDDNATVDLNESKESPVPTALRFTIQSNDLLQPGDKINFGQPVSEGYYSGKVLFTSAPVSLPIGTWTPAAENPNLVLSNDYDQGFTSVTAISISAVSNRGKNANEAPMYTTTWLGQTITTNIIPETYIGDASTFTDFLSGSWTSGNSQGLLLGAYTSNIKYNASLLDGSNPTYDSSVGNTPSGNYVTIWRIDADSAKNILSITSPSASSYGPALGPTGVTLQKSSDNSTNAMNHTGSAVYRQKFTTSALPQDSSDAYITENSIVGSYGVIENSDGSLTIYYNQGNLQEAHPATASNIDFLVFNENPDGISAATPIFTNPNYSSTTSYTESGITLNFDDPTQAYKVNYTLEQYSTGGYVRTEEKSVTTNPVFPDQGMSQGQSVIKIHYTDTSGNVLKAGLTSYGWPANNTIGEEMTPDLQITPPSIPGYTYKSVDVANAASDGSATVPYPEEGKTTDVTYVYTPTSQTAVVNFIDDDDSGKILKTVPLNGVTGGTADYTTTVDIETLKKQGYVLVSDQTGGAKPSFGTTSPTTYEVHLKHDTEKKEETKAVERTIHYVYEDGTRAAADKTDTVTFTRTATKDLVTGDTTATDWIAKDNDTAFDEVASPEITNYTPDKQEVAEMVGLTADSKDIEVTVTYKANTVETTETKEVTQTIHYVYEDGTEAAPDNVDTVTFTRTVTTNEATGEKTYGDWTAKDDDTTFDAVISPEIDHYTPDKQGVPEMVGLTADSTDSVLTVTYKANMVETTETKEVTQTIHYVYEDGTKAADDYADTVTFTRTVTTNEATGQVSYGEWEAKDDDTTFDAVVSPAIANYTADKETVDEVTGVTTEDEDSEVTVTYAPKMETTNETRTITQVIHYVYEDGTQAAADHTDEVTFTRTATKNLATGEVTYSDWQAKDNDTCFDEVNSPKIDNCTADDTCIEETADITAESANLEFTVTYAANTETNEESKEVTRTIHYVYEDGTEAAPDKTDTVTFTRNATTNLLTGEVTYSEWAAVDEDTTFDAVKSAEIDGYTADPETVGEQTGVTETDEDSEVTVTYTKKVTEPSTEPTTEPSETPEEPEEPADTKTSTKPATSTTKTTNEKKLPQTGEKTSTFAIYGGVALIAAALLGVFFKRTRRNPKK